MVKNTSPIEFDVVEHSNNNEQHVHRMDNHLYLQEGMYCRSLKAFPNVCEKGDILLITQLNYADNNLHSVQVIAHPRYNAECYKTMLLNDFDQDFTPIPKIEGERIREAEVDAIHLRYKQHEEYVTNLQSDAPHRRNLAMEIYSRRIEHKPDNTVLSTQPVPTNALEIIKNGDAKKSIQNLSESLKFHTDILKIETNILAEETQKLKMILNEIIPFTEQRMIAAKVSTNEVTEQAARLEQGIASLKLYSGETVHIEEICKGVSAPSNLPITMVQQRLYGDLEIGIFNEDTGLNLDVFSEPKLLEEIRSNPEFVKQIFPTERCIVLMQLRHRDKDYHCPIENYVLNEANRRVFLLVRDGGNIYQVFSPIASHEVADRLFPSRTDLDDLFKCGQIDITIDDLWYSKSFNLRERAILHYKRYLLLIAGLDHNHKLFGEFYPQGEEMEIFYPHFQEKYFHFIHDADGEGLVGSGFKVSLSEWIKQHNSKAVVGSMVLIDLRNFMDEYNAPTCFKVFNHRDGAKQIGKPTERMQYLRIQEDSEGLFVRAEVVKTNEWGEIKGKPVKTRIGVIGRFQTNSMLLLNNVSPDHLFQFINNRTYRAEVFSFIEIFKHALKLITKQFSSIEPLFNTIYESVSVLPNLLPLSKMELEMEIIDTINMWQTKTRKNYPDLSGTMQKKALIQICDALYYRVTTLKSDLCDQAVSLVNDGSKPLQFTVSFDGTMYLYSITPLEQQDHRFSAHAHVNRHKFKLNKQGQLTLEQSVQAYLSQYQNYEHVLHNFDAEEVNHWIEVSKPYTASMRSPYVAKPTFDCGATKTWTLDAIDQGYKVFVDLVANKKPSEDVLQTLYKELELIGNAKSAPVISLPIALVDENIVVAVMQNSDEVLQTLKHGQSFKTSFELKKISLNAFINWKCHFALPSKEVSKVKITATQDARKIFGPSIAEIFSRCCSKDCYVPIQYNSMYNTNDVFAFDKLIENPYYNEQLYLTDIMFCCSYNSRYQNGVIIEATKHDLYMLVGPNISTDTLRDIGKAIEIELPSSFSYNFESNLIAPMDVEPTIQALINSYSKNAKDTTYLQEFDKAVLKASIQTMQQVYEREIPINLEQYKDYKLYCLLKQN